MNRNYYRIPYTVYYRVLWRMRDGTRIRYQPVVIAGGTYYRILWRRRLTPTRLRPPPSPPPPPERRVENAVIGEAKRGQATGGERIEANT